MCRLPPTLCRTKNRMQSSSPRNGQDLSRRRNCVLLRDASNAFKSLNREAMLYNTVSPPLSTYINNCYGTPARLFIAGGEEIKLSEGTT
jgi:hypothetical protein